MSVCAARLSSRFLAAFRSSTNAIARSVESRAGLLQILQRLSPPRVFAGFVARRRLVPGSKIPGSALIFVQNAVPRYPIRSGIHPMFGCLPVCSTQMRNWKYVPICLSRQKRPGTRSPRTERNMKPFPSYRSLSSCFTRENMPDPALDVAHFGRRTPRDKAAQRRSSA